jgi:tetratricopeptide (TPR) repeat protein
MPKSGRHRPDSRRAPPVAAVGVALVVVTLGVFGSVLPKTFINYDDDVYVTANPHVQQGLSWSSIAWALTTTEASNWHPLSWLSHMLDVQLYGLDAAKHHWTSLLLHAANTALLFLVFVRMTGALWRSAFVAALFALHPLHVESFAWIAERKDVLSTFFWMLTLAAWLRFLDARSAGRYAAVVVLYALGLMAKPMLVTLPFTLLLLDVWPLGRWTPSWLGLVREKAPLFAMSAASCVVTAVAQRKGGALQGLEHFPFADRLANAIASCAIYLGKTVWPASLAVFYPHPHIELPSLAVAGSALAIAGLTFLAIKTARSYRFVAFGWLWYLGTLVPVIGLVQVGGQGMADRYTYVPLIGIFVATAWGAGAAAETNRQVRNAAAIAACASIVVLAVLSRAQLATWADRETLFRHALAVTSDNWVAHHNLGTVLFNQGKPDEAIVHLTETLRLQPSYTEAHYNLGLALERTGKHAEAIAQFERALQLRPTLAKAHNNIAIILAGEGRTDEAIQHLREAIRIDPLAEKAYFNLGNILLQAGRGTEAVEAFEHALRLKPDDGAAAANLREAREALSRRP